MRLEFFFVKFVAVVVVEFQFVSFLVEYGNSSICVTRAAAYYFSNSQWEKNMKKKLYFRSQRNDTRSRRSLFFFQVIISKNIKKQVTINNTDLTKTVVVIKNLSICLINDNE